MKRFFPAALAVLASLGMAACSSGGGDDVVRIAVLPKGTTHQFWLTVRDGAQAAANEAGVQMVWNGPDKETQIDKQIGIFENMMALGVDAIVLAACDAEALNRQVQQAANAGIPVITIDSGVTSDLPASFVATDNVEGAKKAADYLSELLGGQGDVGLIPFVPGAATSEMREQGFKEGLKNHPGLNLADVQYSESDESKAMSVTQDMLTANPNIKGIFAASEPSCIGAAQALRTMGKSGEVALVGFDAAVPQIQALRDGAIQALIVQNPYMMGYEGLMTAVRVLRGEEVPKRIDTGVVVVTPANIDTPEVQKLLNPQG